MRSSGEDAQNPFLMRFREGFSTSFMRPAPWANLEARIAPLAQTGKWRNQIARLVRPLIRDIRYTKVKIRRFHMVAAPPDSNRPYAAPANIISVLQRLRSRKLPEVVDVDYLRDAGIPDGDADDVGRHVVAEPGKAHRPAGDGGSYGAEYVQPDTGIHGSLPSYFTTKAYAAIANSDTGMK